MPTLRRHLWLLVLAVGVATPSPAWPKPQCKDRCAADLKECSKLCVEHAGPKAVGYCKKACGDESKRCEGKCAKKSR